VGRLWSNSRWLLIVGGGVVQVALGLALNAAAGEQRWPGILDIVRRYPWIVSVVAAVILAAATALLDRQTNARSNTEVADLVAKRLEIGSLATGHRGIARSAGRDYFEVSIQQPSGWQGPVGVLSIGLLVLVALVFLRDPVQHVYQGVDAGRASTSLQETPPSTQEPPTRREVADEFLGALQAKNFPAARDTLCRDGKEKESTDVLRDDFRLKDHTITAYMITGERETKSSNGEDVTAITATLTYESGNKIDVEIKVVGESGGKVCGFKIPA
jgi:hypothetical protein